LSVLIGGARTIVNTYTRKFIIRNIIFIPLLVTASITAIYADELPTNTLSCQIKIYKCIKM